MLVTSQCHGHRVTGILVGQSNVQRYFPRNITQIELQLGHLRIECGLPSHFWNGKPEICDARLCLWLESKIHDAQSLPRFRLPGHDSVGQELFHSRSRRP